MVYPVLANLINHPYRSIKAENGKNEALKTAKMAQKAASVAQNSAK